MKFFKCLFAGHRYQFRTNLHGDRTIFLGGARSAWACAHCGKIDYRKEPYEGSAAKSAPATTEKESA